MAAALRSAGNRVAVFKPVVTGLNDPGPYDQELLGEAAGVDPATVAMRTYGPPVSPHLAAELAGEELDLAVMVAGAQAAAEGADVIVVEGVGGLLVPLTADHTVRDFAVALRLPLVVAARPGLGTINHTLLTLESARAANLEVRAVVLTPWPDQPSVMERSNRTTIERLGAVEVATLGRGEAASPADAARWSA